FNNKHRDSTSSVFSSSNDGSKEVSVDSIGNPFLRTINNEIPEIVTKSKKVSYCPSGVSFASVVILATSDPALGSVIARQMIFSPFRHGPATLSFSSLEPKKSTGGSPMLNPA